MIVWPVKPLSEVLELRYGKNLPSSDRLPGQVAVFGSNGRVGDHAQALTAGPTVVLGRKGSIGAVHFSPTPCWPIDTTYFVDRFEGQDPSFWAYQLRSLNLASLNRSTAVPGISREDIYRLQVIVPPLDAQRRIAAKLDALLAQSRAAREQLEAVPALVETYRQSVLAAAFRGDLTADWRKKNPNVEPASKLLERIRLERRSAWEAAELAKMTAKGKPPKDDKWKSKYVEPEPVDTTGLPTLPPTWQWTSMASIAEFVTTGNTPPSGSMTDSGEIPFIKINNLTFTGALSLSKLTFISKETHEGLLNRSRLRPGDVLMNIVGPPLGKVSVVPETIPEANTNQAVVAVRPLPQVDPMFLVGALRSPNVIGPLHATGKATAGQTNVAVTACRALPLPLAPFAEQVELVRRLRDRETNLERANAAANWSLARLGDLETTILARAFSGDLG